MLQIIINLLTKENIIKNLKHFWSFVNNKRLVRSSIPNIMEWGEKSESDTQSVCNLFVEFFQNTYFINWSDHTNIVEQRP